VIRDVAAGSSERIAQIDRASDAIVAVHRRTRFAAERRIAYQATAAKIPAAGALGVVGDVLAVEYRVARVDGARDAIIAEAVVHRVYYDIESFIAGISGARDAVTQSGRRAGLAVTDGIAGLRAVAERGVVAN
jgi:hypothetical protein